MGKQLERAGTSSAFTSMQGLETLHGEIGAESAEVATVARMINREMKWKCMVATSDKVLSDVKGKQ